jgi:hypothetical protein
MPKVILELEMPESCTECMFKECLNRTTSVEVSRCIILHKMHVPGSYCPAEGRQADCPLKLVEGKDEQTNVKCRYCNLMIIDKQEIDRLKEKLNAVLQDFYQYVQGGKEICAFCLHDHECEPGETKCGATYKGFRWRGLNESEVEEG